MSEHASAETSPKSSPPLCESIPEEVGSTLRRQKSTGPGRVRPRILPMAEPERVVSPTRSGSAGAGAGTGRADNLGAKRMSFGWFVRQPMSSGTLGSPVMSDDRTTQMHSGFIMRRIQQNTNEKHRTSTIELQRSFSGSRGHHRSLSDADWDFWTQVVEDYQGTATNQPLKLKNAIITGFPKSLRPILWQIISNSRSADLEKVYETLVTEQEVPHSRAIEKDIHRTPLVKEIDPNALTRILRAYSLFDPEVGYTQGMAFIATPLLFDIPESDVFCLFVQLMKSYDFRSLFLPEMPGLHLKLYQFERLLEDRLEKVYIHLRRQGVLSSMYASQWFLTVFAYKFPLELVERIFDVVIAEGQEVVLRFALVLMTHNADRILSLKFDELLPFLKDNIFDMYLNRAAELVRDANTVDITPQILAAYELEYQEIQRNERERLEQMDALRGANSKLTYQVRQLEYELGALNTEHVEIANKMVETGLEVARLTHENEELLIENKHLRASVEDDTFEVVKERDQLKEIRKRLEAQIEGLQQALSVAME